MLDFYKGMDISFLQQYEENGLKICDFDGEVVEPLKLLKKYGVNSIRLRLWVQPELVPESGGYCSLSRTIEMAKRVKQKGFDFLLNLHYSDWWADPGKQNKPKAWESLRFEELEQTVYRYTKETLLAFKKANAMPDIVQIGNEIRSGLLFPDGELPDYDHMVRLVNAGIRGAREAGKDKLLVMIHLDQGGRYFYLKEWFSKAFAAGLSDFDVIGLSYYPFWHGTFNDLRETTLQLIKHYEKPILIVETAHAWRRSKNGFIDEAQERIAGFEASPKGQRKVLDLVNNIMASLPEKMGRGIYYWEPLCIPSEDGGGWEENMGLLTAEGQVMEGIYSFAFCREQIKNGVIAKIYEPEKISTVPNKVTNLPKSVKVLMYDGQIASRPVRWSLQEEAEKSESLLFFAQDSISFRMPGCAVLLGTAEGTDLPVTLEVSAADEEQQKKREQNHKKNLLCDAEWENGLAYWEIKRSSDEVTLQIYPEFAEPFPAPPINALRIESPRNFTFSVSQKVSVLYPGKYSFQAEYMGADTTGVEVRLYLISDGVIQKECIIHPTEHEWQRGKAEIRIESPGIWEVGLSIASPPVYGLVRRFSFIKA